MVSFRSLRDVNLKEFEVAADGYHLISSSARTAKDELNNSIIAKSLPNPGANTTESAQGLIGEAAAAARNRLLRLSKNFHYTQVECGLLSASLNAFTSEMRSVRKKLDSVLAEAETAGLSVGDDGTVSYPPGGKEVDGKTPEGGSARGFTDPTAKGVAAQAANFMPNPKAALAQECADGIAHAVREATEIDERWSPKLERLKAQEDLIITAKDWANVHGDQRAVQKVAGEYLDKGNIPDGESPAENAKWWRSLSNQEQADHLSLYPASIGALDGLPAEVRDEANRAVLAEKRGSYEMQLQGIPPRPTHAYAHPGGSQTNDWRDVEESIREWEEKYGDEYARLNGSLKGMQGIENRFAQTGVDGLPEAYLLEFNPQGTGRTVIANGNPDSADHTAVFVPGTSSNLEGISGNITRMTDLWRDAQSKTPEQDVSTVTWLGYDAPQSVIPDAMSTSWAERGAPHLNNFLSGLEATQGGPDSSHTTVIGHSYGSTTVGQASIAGDLAADDIVTAGSPGTLVSHAKDLDVGRDHVWAEGAGINQGVSGFDPVPALGKLAGLGGSEWKVDTWNNIPIDIGYNQSVPTDEAFDAHRMKVDTPGHTNYWVPGSTSLDNQSSVVTGNYDEVILE